MAGESPDILLENGELPLNPQHAAGLPVIAQRCGIRLNTHQGDWALDTSKGIPWAEWLGQKPYPIDTMAIYLRREINEVAGVNRVLDWSATQDGETVRVSGVVLTEHGTLSLTITPPTIESNLSIGFIYALGSGGIIP